MRRGIAWQLQQPAARSLRQRQLMAAPCTTASPLQPATQSGDSAAWRRTHHSHTLRHVATTRPLSSGTARRDDQCGLVFLTQLHGAVPSRLTAARSLLARTTAHSMSTMRVILLQRQSAAVTVAVCAISIGVPTRSSFSLATTRVNYSFGRPIRASHARHVLYEMRHGQRSRAYSAGRSVGAGARMVTAVAATWRR